MMRQARARELQSRMRAERLRQINLGLEQLLEAAVAQASNEIDLRTPGHRPAPAHAEDPWSTEIFFPDEHPQQLAS